MTKTCPKCYRALPLDEFHKNASRGDGYTDRCKSCMRDYWRDYKDTRQDWHDLDRDEVARSFWVNVEKSDVCWVWIGALTTSSTGQYGVFSIGGGKIRAHRIAYELANGTIPDGHLIDHRCHNTICVRPDHLRAVTHSENMQNRAGATTRSKSGVRGVSWDKGKGKWRVTAYANKRKVHGGYFSDIEEADRVAVALRNKLMTHNDLDKPSVADH